MMGHYKRAIRDLSEDLEACVPIMENAHDAYATTNCTAQDSNYPHRIVASSQAGYC